MGEYDGLKCEFSAAGIDGSMITSNNADGMNIHTVGTPKDFTGRGPAGSFSSANVDDATKRGITASMGQLDQTECWRRRSETLKGPQ